MEDKLSKLYDSLIIVYVNVLLYIQRYFLILSVTSKPLTLLLVISNDKIALLYYISRYIIFQG